MELLTFKVANDGQAHPFSYAPALTQEFDWSWDEETQSASLAYAINNNQLADPESIKVRLTTTFKIVVPGDEISSSWRHMQSMGKGRQLYALSDELEAK